MRFTRSGVAIAAVTFAFPAASASAQEYYADIRPVLAENCMGCHSDAGIAWSMEDPDETYERRGRIARAVENRRMPPWLAEAGHQSYVGDVSLDPETVALLQRWAEDGFARGTPVADPPVPSHHGFAPDLSLDVLGGASYLPDEERSDDYRCFIVDWTPDQPSYVTGFRAVPGNLKVAHHVVVHAITPEMADRFRELDDAEEGMGYQCFGGALPDRLGKKAEREAYEARYPEGLRELNRGSFWLAHWAPGMDGHVFPEGTGLLVEPGSVLVVQMHYYSLEAPGEQDVGSTIDFQVASAVERPAFHLPQTRNRWLAGEDNGSMVMPPGEQVTYEVSDRLGDLVSYISRVTGVDEDRIEGLEVHSANLHMHAIGHSGVITLTDENGKKEVLLSVPRWDLAWQRDFTFVEPKVFTRDQFDGTSIAVQCTFENSKDHTVYGGFGSDEEMCFNFSYIAVRTGDVKAQDAGLP